MFIDEIEITLKAGHGGAGKVSFFAGKHSGPDGGNGGAGGDLYAVASNNITNLNNFLGKHEISAQAGEHGDSNTKFGAKGEDLKLRLPVGTLLIDTQTEEQIELTKEDQEVLLCKGGRGGQGNDAFKSAARPAPHFAQPGEEGEKKRFKILVRMIAGFGLIGLPNAGKSSLLNELTNAGVAVAAYPFTTLQPNLGVLNRRVIADIPGLIEGASQGKGLGIKFLKHIEKVRLLLHCISAESEDVVADYKTTTRELEEYKQEFKDKKQTIILTKSDLVDEKKLKQEIRLLGKFQKDIIPVSIYDFESIEGLKKYLDSFKD